MASLCGCQSGLAYAYFCGVAVDQRKNVGVFWRWSSSHEATG